MASVFERVRTACRAAADRATSGRIDRGRIPAYAASLPLAQASCPTLDPRYHYLGHGEETVAFVLTLDAINFGSGYFPHLRKRPGLSGYFTVAAALNDYYQARGPAGAVYGGGADRLRSAPAAHGKPSPGQADDLLETVARWQWRLTRWRRGTKGWLRQQCVAVRCWRMTGEGHCQAG
jgi:hypothetical protein